MKNLLLAISLISMLGACQKGVTPAPATLLAGSPDNYYFSIQSNIITSKWIENDIQLYNIRLIDSDRLVLNLKLPDGTEVLFNFKVSFSADGQRMAGVFDPAYRSYVGSLSDPEQLLAVITDPPYNKNYIGGIVFTDPSGRNLMQCHYSAYLLDPDTDYSTPTNPYTYDCSGEFYVPYFK